MTSPGIEMKHRGWANLCNSCAPCSMLWRCKNNDHLTFVYHQHRHPRLWTHCLADCATLAMWGRRQMPRSPHREATTASAELVADGGQGEWENGTVFRADLLGRSTWMVCSESCWDDNEWPYVVLLADFGHITSETGVITVSCFQSHLKLHFKHCLVNLDEFRVFLPSA